MRTKVFRYFVSVEFRRYGLTVSQAPEAGRGEVTWVLKDLATGLSGRIRVKVIKYQRQANGAADPVAFSSHDYQRHEQSQISTVILCVDPQAEIKSLPPSLASSAHGGVYRSLFVLTPPQMDWMLRNDITSGQILGSRLTLGDHFVMSIDTSVDTPFADAVSLVRPWLIDPRSDEYGTLLA